MSPRIVGSARVRRGATLFVLLLLPVLASCWASQPPPPAGLAAPGPGFLLGFWHGFIAPIAFVVSLFDEAVRIYAHPNIGLWYDFGFMLGISGFSGGVFAGSRKNRK